MNTAENFAIVANCCLVLGVLLVCLSQALTDIKSCVVLSWYLLIPSVVYYGQVTYTFHTYEKRFQCEPGATRTSCMLSIVGCLMLQAIATYHARILFYQAFTLEIPLLSYPFLLRVSTTVVAWLCFVATVGFMEGEKLALVSQAAEGVEKV